LAVDPTLNTTFDCFTNIYAGTPITITSITGAPQSNTYTLSANELVIITGITGYVVESHVIHTDTDFTVVTGITGWAIADVNKASWVAWSQIGHASFEVNLTNDAGYRPMSWSGYVYQILRLGKNAIVYGSDGITLMLPVGSPMPTFGFKELLDIGVMNKTAIAGDDKKHFFISSKGDLWINSEEGIKNLGYKEFLSKLTNPVMILDSIEEQLLISDASKGYIFKDSALGGGYGNLTGIQYVSDIQLSISPGVIDTPPMHIMTNVFDFGRRGTKTLENLQFGLDSADDFWCAVDFRYNKKEPFRTSPWIRLNEEGVAFLRIVGIEFRVRLRNLNNYYSELHYINMQVKYTDRRFARSFMGTVEGK